MIFPGFIQKHFNFNRFCSGLSYYSNPHHCDNNFDNFVDDNLADFDESAYFFNFSADIAPHVSLNLPLKALHQENSRNGNNRHFDKLKRKRWVRLPSLLLTVFLL